MIPNVLASVSCVRATLDEIVRTMWGTHHVGHVSGCCYINGGYTELVLILVVQKRMTCTIEIEAKGSIVDVNTIFVILNVNSYYNSQILSLPGETGITSADFVAIMI